MVQAVRRFCKEERQRRLRRHNRAPCYTAPKKVLHRYMPIPYAYNMVTKMLTFLLMLITELLLGCREERK
jgi:hypothetical protein